ncbi:hypothetical protein C8R44DRAFT_745806 [Mycena epipterygia]|nr:hypothetical protein C8R44DRAFT_745806 [Mycena epipterygia]
MRLGSKWCISAGNCKAGQQTNERTVQAIMQPSSKLHIRAGNCKAGQQTNERTVQVIVKPGSKWGGNCETGQSKQGSEWHISAGDCKARQQTNEQMLLAIMKQGSEWCISASNCEVGQQMAYQCSKAVNGVSAQVAGQQMNERMLQAIVKQGSAAGNREAGQQMNERMLQAIVKRGSATGDCEAGQQIMYQHRQLAANANGVSVQASVKQGQQTNEQAVCLCTRLASSGVQQGKGLPYEQQRWAKIEKTSWPGPNMRWGPLAGNRTGPVGLPKLEKRAGSREHGYTHAVPGDWSNFVDHRSSGCKILAARDRASLICFERERVGYTGFKEFGEDMDMCFQNSVIHPLASTKQVFAWISPVIVIGGNHNPVSASKKAFFAMAMADGMKEEDPVFNTASMMVWYPDGSSCHVLIQEPRRSGTAFAERPSIDRWWWSVLPRLESSLYMRASSVGD